MTITIITIGTKPKPEITALINDYSKRLPKHIKLVWLFLKHESGDSSTSIMKESENILNALPQQSKVILLDETGQTLDSNQLSKQIFSQPGQDISFIIGGAYGVNQAVKDKAGIVLSLGRIVYPHQLVRLILTEQIYRSYTIHTGHPYHHQ